jgi:6-phosphogluconolactonase
MDIRYFNSELLLAHALCDAVESALVRQLADRGKAGLVVSGGRSVRRFLTEVGCLSIPWGKISITLSDERWVEVFSEDSNEYQLRSQLKGSHAAGVRIVGLKAQGNTPGEGLAEAENWLKGFPFPAAATVLGFGEDGHVASLFAGDERREGLLTETHSPNSPQPRISMTMSTLSNTSQLFILAPTRGKRIFLKEALMDNDDCPIVHLIRKFNDPAILTVSDP